MTDIFISYSREDRPRIKKLAAALEAEGFSVWWDNHLAGGAEFSAETETRLNEAKAVLVAWSTNSVLSNWVADEATVGRDRGALVPIAIDDVPPKIGFRQFQTIEFHRWNGDSSAGEFRALVDALRMRTGAPRLQQAPAAPRAPMRIEKSRYAIGVILVIAFFAAIVAGSILLRKPGGGAQQKPASATAATALDPAAERAIAEISASGRAEEQAAYSSYVAGDQKSALTILEKLAADLEAQGDIDAAAAAYTRAAAVALLVDQGRGLAARRKALALRPQSMAAFQGLFFDTFLLQGYEAAMRLADEAEARPGNSSDMLGFIYANRAVVESGGAANFAEAERQIAKISALRRKSDSVILEANELWATAAKDYDNDETTRAVARATAGMALEPQLPADYPKNFVVNLLRGLFQQGDWEKVFAIGSENFETRRKNGAFIPMPLMANTCRAGLFLERARAATPYCAPLITQKSATGDSLNKIYSAIGAASAGDAAEAKAELDAARAFAGSNPDFSIRSEIAFAEAYVSGAAGDLDAAASAIEWFEKSVVEDPVTRSSSRSRIATALRLFGMHAIKAGKPFRACEPLERAASLYREIGGEVGAVKSDEMRRLAGCTE